MAVQQKENIVTRIEGIQRFVPFTPAATSYGLEWNALRAVRDLKSSTIGEFSMDALFINLEPSLR